MVWKLGGVGNEIKWQRITSRFLCHVCVCFSRRCRRIMLVCFCFPQTAPRAREETSRVKLLSNYGGDQFRPDDIILYNVIFHPKRINLVARSGFREGDSFFDFSEPIHSESTRKNRINIVLIQRQIVRKYIIKSSVKNQVLCIEKWHAKL